MKSPGFTLLEVIFVLSIFASLASLGFWIGIDFYQSYSFEAEELTVRNLLIRARGQSMNNIRQARHKLTINNSEYFLAAEGYESEALIVPRAKNINISGQTEIVFEKLSGEVLNFGQMVLSDGKHSHVIEIFQNGKIE